MTSKRISAKGILDTALEMAELNGWEALRLHDVAAQMGINLEQVRKYFNQKDDLVEAWFDRADSAMLKDAAAPDYLDLTAQQRLHRSIMAWLNALSAHREITHQMLKYKFEIGHVHLQVLGLLRVSRTVQWFLEAAQRRSENLTRIVEEITVTSIYLATSEEVAGQSGGYYFKREALSTIFDAELHAGKDYSFLSTTRTEISMSEAEGRKMWSVASSDVGLSEDL